MPRPGGPAYGSRPLEIGTDGLDTWELQIKLIGWGSGSDNDGIGAILDPVHVHGTFDTTTRDAVLRFQKAHDLAITGIVDADTFRAIDDEVRLHPISVKSLECPCVTGKNDGPILCRCSDHPKEGKCTGFGRGRFGGKFLHDKIPELASEHLPVYAMKEHAGVDKAAIWAVRALMHRAKLGEIAITAGYRCWHDNYHATDEARWHHRRGTLHLGSSIELCHPGKCAPAGSGSCPECDRVRQAALALCGYQLRWHEPDRVTVGEGAPDASPPTTPFAVHVDTAVLANREEADFVKTDKDAAAPLYSGALALSFPMNLGWGRNPRVASPAAFYNTVEKSKGGFYPLGSGRIWHGGIHLRARKSKSVYAMADGDLVACRVGEAEDAKPLGSRNFVLLKHAWKDKTLYTLYMHLDDGKTGADVRVPWRKALHEQASAPTGTALAAKLDKGDVLGLATPIPVRAGDLLGWIGKAPTDASLHGQGAFLHLEAFSETALLSGEGYTELDASAPEKVADRKAITEALVAAKLLAAPVGSVLLEADVEALERDPDRGRFRSVVLKMESAWSIDWKDAFAKSPTLSFMKDADRDALGDAFDDYRWWPLAKADAGSAMPGSAIVFHHHPIALLLQMAYRP